MKRGKRFVWALAVLLAAGSAVGHDEKRDASRSAAKERAAPGWIERNVERLERAIARLEVRLSGRGGSMMDGCEDMMGGGGMMGDGMMSDGMMGGGGMMGDGMTGRRPNEQWRVPDAGR